jgi:hypothetical protein
MRPMPFVLLPRNVLEGLRECAHQYVHVKKVSALALMDFHQEFVTLPHLTVNQVVKRFMIA